MTSNIRRQLTLGLVVVFVAASAMAQTAPGGKKARELPAAVSQAIQINKPGAEIDKLEVEKESGISLYDIEFKAGQGEIEVAEDGTVIDVTTIIDMKDVPEAAMTAIKTAAKGQAIKQLERAEVRAEIVKEGGKGRISKLSTPRYVYEAELAKGEVEVTPDGRVIKVGK
jgi:hypothetical protein